MPAAAVIVPAVAAIGGAVIQGQAAKSAAKSQARALGKSQKTIRAAATEAKGEILDRMAPALSQYRQGIREAQSEIASGTADIMGILQKYSGNADQIISQSGADAQKAIMGSTASSQGIPMSQFNQQYAQIQNAPPSARQSMMNNFQQALSAGSAAQQQALQTGADPAAAQQTAQQTTVQTAQQQGGGGIGATPQPGMLPGGGQGLTTQQVGGSVGLGAQAQAQPAARQQAYQPQATPTLGTQATGFTGAMSNLQQGYTTGQSALDAATAQARQDVSSGTGSALAMLAQSKEEALGQYEPYTTAGTAAVQQEAALSGALGPEAQQAAIDAYIESPGQAYLRQQQEKALLRNQAAIGGLGGGNVRTALQEQAMNIASTQQQQYLENLRSLATRGQEAAGANTNVISQMGLAGASLTSEAGQTLAQLSQQYGISSADLARMSASEMATLAQNTGINLANIQQATGAARAGLQTELGSGLAQAQAAKTADIANLIQTGATNQLNAEQTISSQLANLATGAGTNIANLQAAQGSSLAAGQYLQGQAWAQGLQGLGQVASNYFGQTQTPTTTTTTNVGATSSANPNTYGLTGTTLLN